jgi:Penicillin binding protein transpeptidase domain/NTF2-like N-terminal transpeptidase domain
MGGGAGNDDAGGGSREPARSAEEQRNRRPAGQQDDRWILDEHGVWRERPGVTKNAPPRPRWNLGVAGRIGIAVVAALAVVLVLGQAGLFSSGKTAASTSGFQPAAPDPALAAHQTAEAFLSAWEHGQLGKAASYTDHPDAAAAALTSYRNGLHLRALHLAVNSATAQGNVAFSVDATVDAPGTADSRAAGTAIWSYTSNLTAYAKNGAWWVRWNPGLVAPNLTGSEKVVSTAVAPGVSAVVNAAGGNLRNAGDPGLDNIAAALGTSAPAGRGSPGIQVMNVGPGNNPAPGTTDILRPPVSAGVIKTTIEPGVESAARSAVQAHADSSMVVIQPSTGHILAIANNDGGGDYALTARVAPGSTNKIITSTALFTTGLVHSPSQPVECPPQTDADGEIINNAGGESEPPGTPFLIDFAASCNNAFDRWYDSLGPKTLAQTAQKYYGLNEPWDIGIGQSSAYYTMPSSASNAELALELFGQGRLATAPLAMASVGATVASGSFKQPIVVAGQRQLAATPLPAKVRQYLWQMMRAVTQGGGTAAGVFDGIGSAVYAKTGTADVSGQSQPNSWMVAFDPALNVAIGCVVLNAGYGAQVAGPEAATVLQDLSQQG